MGNISKTSYTSYLKCPKMLWYNMHGYEKNVSESAQRTLDNGNEFGILAQEYFGACVVVERDADKSMVEQTREYLTMGAENIAEATFVAKGGYCQVDILHKNENGNYDLVEVKSTSQVKPYHLDDIAFQYYVARECVKIDRCYHLHLNSEYRKQGGLTNDLFALEDVTEKVVAKLKSVIRKTKKKDEPQVDPNKDLIGEAIQNIQEMLQGDLPAIRIHGGCDDQWECPFMEDCISSLSDKEKALMSCEGLTWKQSIKCLEKGEMVYPKGKEILTMADDEVICKKEEIKAFLDKITYPLYLLDFESIQNIIPQYYGQKAWQQTPFQYSLHIIEKPGDPAQIIHREFLWDKQTDPRPVLVHQLITDIPADACVMAYNMMFERGIIADLAVVYPEYAEHLMAIHTNCIDLMEPFRKNSYYKGDMKGSYSIKKVLPSCYPDDPTLNYHNLDEVQNGTMAQEKYLELIQMEDGPEKENLRKNMLKYCELDTYAMYKLLVFLIDLAESN